MSSETSTERAAPFTAGHLYVLLSMIAATVAVVVSRHTHPAALLLISAAVLAAGYTAYALHRALTGLLSGPGEEEALGERQRELLQREKALVLRAIKDLEFDFGMKKVSQADYDDMRERLRARALLIMEQLERVPLGPLAKTGPGVATGTGVDLLETPGEQSKSPAQEFSTDRHPSPSSRPTTCPRCQTRNEPDAKFCKQCGDRLGSVNA